MSHTDAARSEALASATFWRHLRSLSAYKHSSHENLRRSVKAAMLKVDEGKMVKWSAEAA